MAKRPLPSFRDTRVTPPRAVFIAMTPAAVRQLKLMRTTAATSNYTAYTDDLVNGAATSKKIPPGQVTPSGYVTEISGQEAAQTAGAVQPKVYSPLTI